MSDSVRPHRQRPIRLLGHLGPLTYLDVLGLSGESQLGPPMPVRRHEVNTEVGVEKTNDPCEK